jgi:hypothetical protein
MSMLRASGVLVTTRACSDETTLTRAVGSACAAAAEIERSDERSSGRTMPNSPGAIAQHGLEPGAQIRRGFRGGSYRHGDHAAR